MTKPRFLTTVTGVCFAVTVAVFVAFLYLLPMLPPSPPNDIGTNRILIATFVWLAGCAFVATALTWAEGWDIRRYQMACIMSTIALLVCFAWVISPLYW